MPTEPTHPMPADREPVDMNSWIAPGYKNAQLNYFLNLLNFIIPLASIVAVVFAYMNRDGESVDDVLYAHYQFQIRTFWIGLLYMVIGFVTTFILIGFLVIFLTSIWWLARNIKGLIYVSRKEGLENVNSWLI